VSILKSFADWEQLRSDFSNQGSIVESREEDASRSLATSNPSISATVMLGSNQILRNSVVQSLKELAGKPAKQIFVNSVNCQVIQLLNSSPSFVAFLLKRLYVRPMYV